MYEEDKNRLGPTGNAKRPLDCAECEALMADVLDVQVSGGDVAEGFRSHLAACAGCRSMFDQVVEGLHWMKLLEEIEPPAEMFHKILVATVGSEPMPAPTVKKSLLERLLELPALQPILGTVLEPRFAMSFGMAFFSIMLIISMLGFKIATLRKIDLRPSAVARTYYETEGKVVKYYDNVRFVLELESRMRELKQVATPQESPKQGEGKGEGKEVKKENRDTSQAPRTDDLAHPGGAAMIAGLGLRYGGDTQ